MTQKTIVIEGMGCAHCVAAVQGALETLPGVQMPIVNLETGTATLEADDTVTDAALRDAIEDAGYDVTDIR